MESLTRRRAQPAILFVFLFLFISLNQLSVTLNSAPIDNEVINYSHLMRKLRVRPATTGRPPSPVPNTNKQFEVPPGPPPPQDNGQ
ncbi:hypothetical protein MKX01_018925 [Papaver californicum]|nr:hypothetical protein MKX01_018925 [Papaver californicum]